MTQEVERQEPDEVTDVAVTNRDAGRVAVENPLTHFGLKIPDDAPVIPAKRTLAIGGEISFTLDVAYINRAEAFYHDFFEMDVVFRAWQDGDGWRPTTEPIDWEKLMFWGEYPQLVYLARPGWSILLLGVGRGFAFTPPKLGDAEVPVSPRTLRKLRARVLMRGYTLVEDTRTAFAFRDPYAVVWRLVEDDSLRDERAAR